ncbi:SPW repeat domain-containing protein [Bremerella volcania]|uniref:SPW repeat domain-containing protein n=1 Tax=Bremerella volcania TaxID=2527984 RepID=UPI0011A39C9E|nr:hypothetical protein [Bremerella volcania]
MWPRVVEFMLGCWLLCSPFIFREENHSGIDSYVDFGLGSLVISFSALAFWRPARYSHLATLFVSLLMILVPRFALSPEISPAGQNFMVIGLLLLMFAMIPNKAFSTPSAWQKEMPSQASQKT